MRNVFFILIAICFSTIPCFAILELEQSTTPECLINSGYSTEMAEMVNFQKSRATSSEFVSIKQTKPYQDNIIYKFCRRCLIYLDPALDDNSFYNHDIEWEPRTTDL